MQNSNHRRVWEGVGGGLAGGEADSSNADMQVFEEAQKDFWQSLAGKWQELKGRSRTSSTIGISSAVVVQIEWVGGCSRMQINQCLCTTARAKRRWNM